MDAKKQSPLEWVCLGNLLISCATPGPIPSEIWNAYIEAFRKNPIKKYLGVTVGSAETTSLQRKQIFETLKGRGIQTSIVTDEKIARGIVTAASWVGVDVKAFSWMELRDAINHLGMPQESTERVVAAVNQLKTSGHRRMLTR